MGTTNYHRIFVGKCIDLAATIVIKSVDTAEAMNNYVRAFYGELAVDLSDPRTWRYYKNLSGDYHFTDTLMYVVSMDTLEQIAFTKENLEIHRATARAYQYGMRQYQELVMQYPRQEMLIRGILYPVDIEYAAADSTPDSAILGGYPSALIEVNEYTLLDRLQTWINRFRLRWFNRAYTVTDNLYLPSHLGIMYALLPQVIISLRKEACKTNEAHSFHVSQYLMSHADLGQYLDQLTTSQALSLYRNILYLERNPGQRQIFSWLIDKALTERTVPLAQYTMRHDVSALSDKTQTERAAPVQAMAMRAMVVAEDATSPDVSAESAEIYPEVFMKRSELNLGYSFDTQDRLTLSQMLQKEVPTARDNAIFLADYQPAIEEAMLNSASNVLQTKALESAMVDYTDATPYTMDTTLLSHWLWLAHKGLYTAMVNVENPHTGERIALPAKDSYALMMFAFCKSIGFTLDAIPPFSAMHVQRIPLPSPADLMSVVDPTRVDISVAKWLLRYPPLIQQVISSEAFYNQCQEIWRAQNIQNNIVALQEHHLVRGYVDNMMNRCYADVLCDLFPGENYTDWFAGRNLDVSTFTSEEFGLLYANITRAATGLNLLTTKSVASLQRAMIGLLQQLSSYSVQFLSYINTGPIVTVGYPVVRQGDISGHISDEWEVPALSNGLQQFTGAVRYSVYLPINDADFDTRLYARVGDQASLTLPDPVGFPAHAPVTYRLHQDIGTSVSYVEDEPADTEGIFPVLGIGGYLALAPEQRSRFKDVYGTDYGNRPV